MNRPGKDRTVRARLHDGRALRQKDHSIASWARRIAPQVEEGLVRLLLPGLAAAAVLLFFTIIYGLVDDLLVAGVIAGIAPMMVLPLFRKQGIN